MRRLTRTYAFSDDEALDRIRALSDYWHTKHSVDTAWVGSVGRLRGKKMGVSYDATVRVGDGRVDIEVDAGWLADKLGAPAYVERKLDTYLDPAESVASLRARIPRS
ncbi:MAG: polyhydroxyalkanoic acid system family protein [Sandaracinaceae bacterium]